MKALVYGVRPEPWEAPQGATGLLANLAHTPVALRDVPDASPLRNDWVILRPRLTGICGSDAKQMLGDFEGDADSALSGMCSFPQILGHEIVADIVELGPNAHGVAVGQRVVVDPWIGCVPRGVPSICSACAAGDSNLCENFDAGDIARGIHLGTSSDAGGGFAQLVSAHPSMCYAVPNDVDDENAVLADPFAVALHAVIRTPPQSDDDRVLIWGAGTLGLCTLAILRAFYPSVRVAIVARFAAQASAAETLGADLIVPTGSQSELVVTLARWSNGRIRPTMEGLDGLPMCLPGGIQIAYDTIGKPETFEVETRVLATRGSIVVTGVHVPGRWEWSPHYFKEIAIVGSNAFGVETLHGVRQHAIAHYLDLVTTGQIDLGSLVTHTFGLADWREAFVALANQETSGAIKVALQPNR